MAPRFITQLHDKLPSDELDIVKFLGKEDSLPVGLTKEEFDGSPKAVTLWREAGKRQILVGLGSRDSISAVNFRKAAGTALRKLRSLGVKELIFDLTGWSEHVLSAVEGALLAEYKFEEYLPSDKKRTSSLTRLHLLVRPHDLAQARVQARNGELIAAATNAIRHIGNLPPNVLTPMSLADKARDLVESRSALKFSVLEERQLKAQKFGGILAVGQGSKNPPCLIKIEYRGNPDDRKGAPIALVGKAVTFDTGGISIKPSDRMEEMKWDKMGGLAVLGVMLAAADLKLPLNLVGLIPSAENMPSAEAYRPGDIISTHDGKTIEVINTDAEGRIILADAVAHARLTYSPSVIINVATLTGAVIVALGHKRAGLFSTHDEWAERFQTAAEETGEPIWPLPLDEEFLEGIQSDVAVVKNRGSREGGASQGASFVKVWAESTPFVHLDIAGTAWITKQQPDLEPGATGFGTRLILRVLDQLSNQTLPRQ